jgi:DNA-binding transcriptional LysR family regulator
MQLSNFEQARHLCSHHLNVSSEIGWTAQLEDLMDRLTGMDVFVKVVEASSFAAAARHLRISPAMVSSHVRALEERLGARLLDRTTRRVNPTEVGQSYYERCIRILAEVDEAERAAGDANSTPRGHLRVTAPFTFGTGHVVPAIAEYLATCPDVSVELALNDRLSEPLEEGFDLAIRVGPLPDSSLIARRLISAETVICASPEYLSAHEEPTKPQDLARHNCLVHSRPRGGEWSLLDRHQNTITVRVSGRFIANNGDVLRALALKGQGIICVPSFIVDADLATGALVQLLGDYGVSQTPVSAVYPHSRFLSAKVRAFIEVLAAHLDRRLVQPRKQIDMRASHLASELKGEFAAHHSIVQ